MSYKMVALVLLRTERRRVCFFAQEEAPRVLREVYGVTRSEWSRFVSDGNEILERLAGYLPSPSWSFRLVTLSICSTMGFFLAVASGSLLSRKRLVIPLAVVVSCFVVATALFTTAERCIVLRITALLNRSMAGKNKGLLVEFAQPSERGRTPSLHIFAHTSGAMVLATAPHSSVTLSTYGRATWKVRYTKNILFEQEKKTSSSESRRPPGRLISDSSLDVLHDIEGANGRPPPEDDDFEGGALTPALRRQYLQYHANRVLN